MQGEWACSSSFEGIIFALASRAAVGSGFPSTVHRSMGVLVLVALPPAAVKSFRFSVFRSVLERVFVLVLEALPKKAVFPRPPSPGISPLSDPGDPSAGA
jgi:hypothetical protein